MFKKKVSLVLIFCFLVVLYGCSNPKERSLADTKEYKAIETAIANLKAIETPYVVSTMIDAPDGSVQYIECMKEGASYTEYSIDSDGNFGTLEYGSEENMSYGLTDWCTAEGKYYLIKQGEEDAVELYYMPDSYSDVIDGRASMYVEDMLDKFTSIEESTNTTLDIGQGSEKFSTYKCTLPSKYVKELVGVQSYGVYKCLAEDASTSQNVKQLCGYYLEDLDFSLTFSDAKITLGVDKDNILKYICFEVGGLGNVMYITRVVAETNNQNLRQTPDFSEAKPYQDSMSEFADFVASYPSYEEALHALESSN